MGKKKKSHKEKGNKKTVKSLNDVHDTESKYSWANSKKETPTVRSISPENQFIVQMNFRVSTEQKKFLKRLSVELDRTINEILREVIDQLRAGKIQLIFPNK